MTKNKYQCPRVRMIELRPMKLVCISNGDLDSIPVNDDVVLPPEWP